MNERQLDYFKKKLLDWKDDILREARETVEPPAVRNREPPPTSPTVRRRRPTARWSCAHGIGSERSSRRSTRLCGASKKASTAIAKRRGNRSAWRDWRRDRSRRSVSKPRNATNAASVYTATTDCQLTGCSGGRISVLSVAALRFGESAASLRGRCMRRLDVKISPLLASVTLFAGVGGLDRDPGRFAEQLPPSSSCRRCSARSRATRPARFYGTRLRADLRCERQLIVRRSARRAAVGDLPLREKPPVHSATNRSAA